MLQPNVMITGIPRGGTTLLTAMLDSLPDWVCLSEPSWQPGWIREYDSPQQLAERIVSDYDHVRRAIKDGIPVLDRRSSGGKALTNYYSRTKRGRVRRKASLIPVRFQVSDHFTLGMKHNALYTALLPAICQVRSLSIVSIVRHPVSTILSWRSLRLPVSRGRLPAGEKFWPALHQLASSRWPLLEKQVGIYELFCQRYIELRHGLHLLKYEELIHDPSLFEQLTGHPWSRQLSIQNGNQNKHYDVRMAEDIWRLVERHAPYTRQLYSYEEWRNQSRTGN